MPAANGGPATGKSLASDESGWVMDTGIFVGLGVGSAALVVVAVFGYLFFQRRQKSLGEEEWWTNNNKHWVTAPHCGGRGLMCLNFGTFNLIFVSVHKFYR